MSRHGKESINHAFEDPTQSDDIYPPPPGFDSPSHETDRYRQYDEDDVERSVHRSKPDEKTSEITDENKRRASITKKIWSVLKVTFICACPLFIIGLILVILGTVNVPESYDLTRPGAPILIVAMILLIVSILLLVVYKMRSMNAYDIGEKGLTGIMNNGSTQRSNDENHRHVNNKDSEEHGHQENRNYNESRRI